MSGSVIIATDSVGQPVHVNDWVWYNGKVAKVSKIVAEERVRGNSFVSWTSVHVRPKNKYGFQQSRVVRNFVKIAGRDDSQVEEAK